jgi:hypothetical protein
VGNAVGRLIRAATDELRAGAPTSSRDFVVATNEGERDMRRSLLVVISVVLILGACGGDDSDPAATVDSYIEAYNAADIDLIMTHFTEDSVIIDHPTTVFFSLTADGSSNGLAEIRELHVKDLQGNGYTISNVETSEDTVTWDSVWGDNEGCVEGQTTVVKDDAMLTWTWGTQLDSCP